MLSYQMLHPSYRRTNICTARTSPVLVVASFLFSNVQMVSADASIPKYMDKDGPCPPMHVCWSILDQSQMLADDWILNPHKTECSLDASAFCEVLIFWLKILLHFCP
jgi:hypothetical protein